MPLQPEDSTYETRLRAQITARVCPAQPRKGVVPLCTLLTTLGGVQGAGSGACARVTGSKRMRVLTAPLRRALCQPLGSAVGRRALPSFFPPPVVLSSTGTP